MGSHLSTLSYPMLGPLSSVGESRIHPEEGPAGGQPSLEHQGIQGDLAAQWASITPALWVPCSPLPWGVLPLPVLTLCPAPFPQGFPSSQPGGRESRSTASPLSPRPAQSKVGTGLGARRSRAHLPAGAHQGRGLLHPTGMLLTPRPGTPCRGHPRHPLPSQHSISRPPAWRRLSFFH